MAIERHLDDKAFASTLINPGETSAHIERCHSCRDERIAFESALRNLPEAMRSASEQPQIFWQRQQTAIRSRIAIEEASHQSWAGFAWATLGSLILLAGLLLHGARTSPQPQAQSDPDQELLLEVERAVQSNVPESLAPAALLAEDIRAAVETQASPNSISKESRNEN
jgi:hypothetical protein